MILLIDNHKRCDNLLKVKTIKDMVKDGKKVKFLSFREGTFLYETECGFQFPVPLSDIGNATMLAEDKAILFMRYIRSHMEVLKKGHQFYDERL